MADTPATSVNQTMKRRSIHLLATLLVVLVTVSGCALTRPDLEDPTFRLAGVEPLAMGLFEQRFRLTIRVDNPNDLSLPIRTMRYQLELAGLDFASGMTSDGFTLPARDSTTFEVDVITNLADSLPRLLRLVNDQRDSLDYALRGKVEYGRFIRGERPFEQKGTLQLTF